MARTWTSALLWLLSESSETGTLVGRYRSLDGEMG